MNKDVKDALKLARKIVYDYKTKVLPNEVKELIHKLDNTTCEDATSNRT